MTSRQLYVNSSRKGPTEILDHSVNWADVLVPIEDEIVDFTVDVDGDMKVWSSQFTAYDTTVWLDGGTAGMRYTVGHNITTAEGRKMRRSVLVLCVER